MNIIPEVELAVLPVITFPCSFTSERTTDSQSLIYNLGMPLTVSVFLILNVKSIIKFCPLQTSQYLDYEIAVQLSMDPLVWS